MSPPIGTGTRLCSRVVAWSDMLPQQYGDPSGVNAQLCQRPAATEANLSVETVTLTRALAPSAATVIEVVPAFRPVTVPVASTSAIVGSSDVHVSGRLKISRPFGSRTVVVTSVGTLARMPSAFVDGVITATTRGGVTFTTVAPVMPAPVAVMVTLPVRRVMSSARRRPRWPHLTVAIDVSL